MFTHTKIADVIDDCVDTYSGRYMTGDMPKCLASTLKERLSVAIAADDTEVKKQLAKVCHTLSCVITDAMKLYYRTTGNEPNVIFITKGMEEALALDWQFNMADDMTKEVDFRDKFPRMFGAKLVYNTSDFGLAYDPPLQKGDKLYYVAGDADTAVTCVEYQETRQVPIGPGGVGTEEQYMCRYSCMVGGIGYAVAGFKLDSLYRTEREAWSAHWQKGKLQLELSEKQADAIRRRLGFIMGKITEHTKDDVS